MFFVVKVFMLWMCLIVYLYIKVYCLKRYSFLLIMLFEFRMVDINVDDLGLLDILFEFVVFVLL